MTNQFFRLTATGFLSLTSLFFVAQVSAEADTLMQKLKQSRYEEVNQTVLRYQSAYEHDPAKARDLEMAFLIFSSNDPDLERHLTGWVNEYPKSYAARLARGLYYQTRGDKARGSD